MFKLAVIQPAVLRAWEHGERERILGLVSAGPQPAGFEIVNDAAHADLVVLLESCSFKTRHDIPDYVELIAQHGPQRLMCINYEDGPPGFLPGLYSSLESFRFDARLHRSWPHLRLPNEQVCSLDEDALAFEPEPELLFTFSGARSHPLRRALFERYETLAGRHKVREIKRWYDHNEAERAQYTADIRNSKFVLCPRGIASYSHRILETMAMRRVPVVIADDWVPFSIAEEGYCLRIAERDLHRVDSLLRQAEGRYQALQAQVRVVFEKYFAPAARYTVALRELIALHLRRRTGADAVEHAQRWESHAFWRRNGWCLDQRLAQRLRRHFAT